MGRAWQVERSLFQCKCKMFVVVEMWASATSVRCRNSDIYHSWQKEACSCYAPHSTPKSCMASCYIFEVMGSQMVSLFRGEKQRMNCSPERFAGNFQAHGTLAADACLLSLHRKHRHYAIDSWLVKIHIVAPNKLNWLFKFVATSDRE